MKNVYSISKDTEILEYSNEEIHLSSHDYGKGRGVYIAGLPYSIDNNRLLFRALLYAAHREDLVNEVFTSNPATELNGYKKNGYWALLNNTNEAQTTNVTLNQKSVTINLEPGEIKWFKEDELNEK